MSIAKNLASLKAEIPPHVKIVAVSKTYPADVIREAYAAGHRCFGENRAPELAAKYLVLPEDIEWHFIGHLQSNKVRHIAPFVSLVHSIDSLPLLTEINKAAARNDRVIDCLLQFHIASEETKYGLDAGEAVGILESGRFHELRNIRITGVMGMATLTDDCDMIRREFGMLRSRFEWLKADFFTDRKEFREISMGMSGDYRIAIDEGSTIVRIGTAIFGGSEV